MNFSKKGKGVFAVRKGGFAGFGAGKLRNKNVPFKKFKKKRLPCSEGVEIQYIVSFQRWR
jgi:hypothetical protein